MRIEVPSAQPGADVYWPEQLAAFWSAPISARGAALRRLLGHTYAQALQIRWEQGHYRIVFLHERRDRPVEAPPTGLAERMLGTAFRAPPGAFPLDGTQELELGPPERSAPVTFPPSAWGTVDDALSTWLDEWLLFRRSSVWVRRDDIAPSWEQTLTRPWQRCVGELVGGARWAAATTLSAKGFPTFAARFDRGPLGTDWGDYGTALIIATATDVHVIQVALWTD
ncbi:hypothetical protein [Marinactinospora rubrisoli]|uniref:Uncharacterized protein n=1 Tax=Marinactinospora rubrisoli TaxID=2715399 RepID=A0ABW2KAW6_9ACTN